MNISSDFVRNTMCAIFLGYSCWFVIGLSLPFKSFMFDCHYRRLRWTSWSESKASRFKVTPSTNYLGMSGIPWNIPSLFSHSMICRERWTEDDSQLSAVPFSVSLPWIIPQCLFMTELEMPPSEIEYLLFFHQQSSHPYDSGYNK